MRKILIILTIISASCVSKSLLNDSPINNSDIYNVINTYLINSPDSTKIFFKSYTSKQYDYNFLKNRILINHTNETNYVIGKKKIDSIDEIINLNYNRRKQLKDSIARVYLLPKIEDFLNEKDIQYIRRNSSLTRLKWDETKIKNTKIVRRHGNSIVEISVPTFNEDRTISAFYVKHINNLDIQFYRKNTDGRWLYHCSGVLYTSD